MNECDGGLEQCGIAVKQILVAIAHHAKVNVVTWSDRHRMLECISADRTKANDGRIVERYPLVPDVGVGQCPVRIQSLESGCDNCDP